MDTSDLQLTADPFVLSPTNFTYLSQSLGAAAKAVYAFEAEKPSLVPLGDI